MSDDNSAQSATEVPSRTVRKGGSEDEQEIFGEIVAALKSIRFGSIVLTIHEGCVVEVTRTVRSRFSSKRSD
jgi:hypothetical protein